MQKHYDVTIIGGGVQGCGVAQAAAAAGFSTLLIDKNDWAQATSSASSKLIHGGLRYLQSGQFHLVRECLAERNWMLDHAPSLVRPNWFYLPVYKHSRYSALTLLAGLSLYRLLNLTSPYSRFRWISRDQWAELPGIKTEGLKAVLAYQDGQTDDQQLTRAIQRSAEVNGADCFAYTELVSAKTRTDGFDLTLKTAEQTHNVQTTVLVNASGPWVNLTLSRVEPEPEKVDVEFVQGTHIVIDKRISDICFYLEAPSDGRAIFVMPWKDTSLIGTTETIYQGNPDAIQPLDEEIQYLMDTLNHYFPNNGASIQQSFCGLRVLPAMQKSAFSRPRDVMIHQENNLISLYGGKLTAWRATAEKVLERVTEQLDHRQPIDTRKLPLYDR